MADSATNILEQIPPHDEAAEAGVLGSMLCDERAAGVAVELLVRDDFYTPRHQLLFDLFADLYQKQPDLDLLYVQSELDRRALTERVGGQDTVQRLVAGTPTAANVERYCKIVRDRAVERELIANAAQIIEMARRPDTDEADTLVARAEELIYRVADQRAGNEPVSVMSVMESVLAEAEKHVQARWAGSPIPSPALATGYADLDDKLAGGLWPGEVLILAARPSTGKTTLAINLARHVACRPPEKNPVGVGIFSLEMPKEQVTKNLLCAEARMDSRKMRRYAFDEDDYQDVVMAAKQVQTAPIFIDDSPGLSPAELRSRARRLHHRDGVGMLIVDYLQLMTPDRRHDSREQAVADMSRQVKQIARELSIPVILLSQLRRPPQGAENKKPALTDLRESGSIEQDADVVIMLHRDLDEFNVMRRDVTVIVQKNRNGEVGEVKLQFFPEQFRFENYVPELEEAGQVGA